MVIHYEVKLLLVQGKCIFNCNLLLEHGIGLIASFHKEIVRYPTVMLWIERGRGNKTHGSTLQINCSLKI